MAQQKKSKTPATRGYIKLLKEMKIAGFTNKDIKELFLSSDEEKIVISCKKIEEIIADKNKLQFFYDFLFDFKNKNSPEERKAICILLQQEFGT